jgi:hypothetical protein
MNNALSVVDMNSVPFVGPSGGPVERRTMLFGLSGPNPIEHVVDRENFRVINIAVEGHQFYPGTVLHQLSIA